MPEIKYETVLSVSSEDKVHCSANLLLSEEYRKWKCAAAGEKQVSVVLQMERSSKIDSIVIGNEASAFIEILVGKSTATSDCDFKVLLVSSSFMSPIESKQSSNLNRVRHFHSDKLTKAVCDEQWDRVKIVCTQPFNKNIQYGVSFVKLNSPPSDPSAPTPATPTPKRIGSFTLKNDDAAEDLAPGSLFKKTKTDKETPATVAASARATSAALEARLQHTPLTSPKPVTTPTKHSPVRTQTHKISPPKISPPKKPSATPSRGDAASKSETPKAGKHKTTHSTEDDRTHDTPPRKKIKVEAKQPEGKPLSELMKGVVFVLSGFQNPLRRELRDKATDMGAKYKPDWGPGCTHLICAFSNTPKYEQVKGKGIIVTRRWVEQSHAKKVLMPFKKFTFGAEDVDSSSSSSGEETTKQEKRDIPLPSPPSKRVVKCEDEKCEDAESTDIDDIQLDSSGNDTEDDIRKVQEAEKKSAAAGGEVDIYTVSTDEDEGLKTVVKKENGKQTTVVKDENGTTDKLPVGPDGLPTLPDLFNKQHFFLYGKINDYERHVLCRYITAYDGVLDDYMSDKVAFVITHQKWDKNFDSALSDNAGLKFVRPKWIYTCNQKQQLVSCFSFSVPTK